jgi:hypothetical protein
VDWCQLKGVEMSLDAADTSVRATIFRSSTCLNEQYWGVPGSYIVMQFVGVTECGALYVSNMPECGAL